MVSDFFTYHIDEDGLSLFFCFGAGLHPVATTSIKIVSPWRRSTYRPGTRLKSVLPNSISHNTERSQRSQRRKKWSSTDLEGDDNTHVLSDLLYNSDELRLKNVEHGYLCGLCDLSVLCKIESAKTRLDILQRITTLFRTVKVKTHP
jgi:hypothetical protein